MTKQVPGTELSAEIKLSDLTLQHLWDAGVHYGHQCRRWNPKMRPYIYGSRSGVHLIDLEKTLSLIKKACHFLENTVSRGGQILFVGTKPQAQECVKREAERCGMYYVDSRWLGGSLTNYSTIRQSVHRLKKIEAMIEDGTLQKFTKKEALNFERLRLKLERNLGGVKEMTVLPKVLFIVDAHKERIAIKEAQKLGIKVVAITDTNADPDGVDYVIPANDDSGSSLNLIVRLISEACLEGKAKRRQDDHESGTGSTAVREGTIYDQGGHSVKVIKKR